MGGISLISGGFLATGAAMAVVPILLHLLFRRKAPRIDLGSLRFLQIAVRDNAHRRKIRRWILLAIRTAGVILLGLLFARPYFSGPDTPGRDREVAILVDRSASMGAGGPTRSPFARAREAASNLIRGLPEGTEVHLALFDRSGVTPMNTRQLQELPKDPGPSATDYSRGLSWARDRMVQSRRKVREVHVLTDLQTSQADPTLSGSFPSGVSVHLTDVGRALRGNLAIDDARAIRTEIRPGEPPWISARIFNAGSFAVRDVRVLLRIEGNGQTIEQSQQVTVEGSSRREVRFSPPIDRPGLYQGSVSVDGNDPMPFDDLRWIAFEARTPTGVLLVDGDPGVTPYASETYFLESALRLRGPGAGLASTPFEPRTITLSPGSDWPDLTQTRIIVLANVAELSEAMTTLLREFVEKGGRLILFAGSSLKPGSLGRLRSSNLLPAEITGTIDGPIRFDTWETTHPILGPFSGTQHGDLRSLVFRRIARLKPVDGSVVLASARGDRPLIVERSVGQGRVLQLALAADNDWGDWAIHRLYLPMIHQMMGDLSGRLAGSGLIRSELATDKAPPGIARAGDRLIVRNVGPSESTLDRMTDAEFRDRFQLPPALRKTVDADLDSRLIAQGGRRPGEFWRPIAWSLLILLVAETFVANRTSA